MNRVRGYIFSRPFFGERAPQSIQNLTIRNYCELNNLTYLLSAVEYSMEDSNIILNGLLSNIDEVDGIVAYSVFQLPFDSNKRENLYREIIHNRKIFHFALENLSFSTFDESKYIEILWKTKIALLESYNPSLD